MADIASASSIPRPRDKPVFWISSSLEDLSEFPKPVKKVIGFAIRQAQKGGMHIHAKSLNGYKGASVLEVIADHDTNTFRSVYTICFRRAIYVLHCFQKKSKSGIKTPQREIALIGRRLKDAQEHYENWITEQNRETQSDGE